MSQCCYYHLEGGSAIYDAKGQIIGHKQNRPVLLWPSNKTITIKQARTILKFTSFEVFSSLWKFSARSVEDELQVLPLPFARGYFFQQF